MGLNIYIQRKTPRMVPTYDCTHIAKLSWGWRVHFDGSSMTHEFCEDDPRPRIGSVADIRSYLETGEWELVDEYGERTTLERVLAHDEVTRDGRPWNTRVSLDDYYDREGYPWSRREFA
jgi:hypothetical protein